MGTWFSGKQSSARLTVVPMILEACSNLQNSMTLLFYTMQTWSTLCLNFSLHLNEYLGHSFIAGHGRFLFQEESLYIGNPLWLLSEKGMQVFHWTWRLPCMMQSLQQPSWHLFWFNSTLHFDVFYIKIAVDFSMASSALLKQSSVLELFSKWSGIRLIKRMPLSKKCSKWQASFFLAYRVMMAQILTAHNLCRFLKMNSIVMCILGWPLWRVWAAKCWQPIRNASNSLWF